MLFLLFLLCSWTQILAQRELVDSLKTEVVKKGATAERYVQLALAYVNSAPDSVRWYARKAMEMKPSAKEVVAVESALGDAELLSGNPEKAKQHLEKALEMAKSQKDVEAECGIINSLGIYYAQKKDFEAARKCYEEVFMHRDSVSPNLLFRNYLNFAALFSRVNRYQEALQMARHAREYVHHADKEEQIAFFVAYGTLLVNVGEYKEAGKVLREGVALAKEYKVPLLEVRCLSSLITLLTEDKEQIREVPALIDEATRLVMETEPNGTDRMQLEHGKVNFYMKTRQWAKGLESARYLYEKSPAVSSTRDQIMLMMGSCSEGVGQLDKACHFYREAYYIGDSIRKEEINVQLADAAARYAAKEKEIKIIELEKDAAEYEVRYWRMAGSTVGLLVVLLFSGCCFEYWRRLQRRKTQLMESQRYIDGLESERKRLAQDLHDGVCNDLLVVAMGMSSGLSVDEAAKQLYEVRENVRGISHELMPPNMRFATLDQILSAYVYKLNELGRFEVRFSCDTKMEWAELAEQVSYQSYRMVQELVANIMQHAVPKHIRISLLSFADRKVVLEVEDDAPHADCQEVAPPGGNGIGLRSVAERVTSLGATINVLTMEDGCRLTRVEIPDAFTRG